MADPKRHVTSAIMLMANCPWLIDRAHAFDFLQKECSSDVESELIFELLERFDYLDNPELTVGFQSMADQILNNWSPDPKKTIICPPKVDSGADSGPSVVQTLKSIFAKKKIYGIELIITINKLKDHAKQRDNVIIVDDFSGTGKTILNKLKTIRELQAYKENPPKIFVCLLASAKMARNAIEPHVDGYYSWREYDRGITDYYSEPKLSEYKKAMEEIEARFNPEIRGEKMPNFGYGCTEVLMGWESNLPNSVFPVFWWPEYLATGALPSVERMTLFHRYI